MAVTHLTDNNFDEITNTNKTILVDFFANWCGPCKMLAPIIEELANEAKDYEVYKVDVDENIKIARRFNITNIPTLVVMKDGNIINQAVGFMTKDDILQILEKNK